MTESFNVKYMFCVVKCLKYICLEQIMCLQEVQEDHYQKQLKPCLERLGMQYLAFTYSSVQNLAKKCCKVNITSKIVKFYLFT